MAAREQPSGTQSCLGSLRHQTDVPGTKFGVAENAGILGQGKYQQAQGHIRYAQHRYRAKCTLSGRGPTHWFKTPGYTICARVRGATTGKAVVAGSSARIRHRTCDSNASTSVVRRVICLKNSVSFLSAMVIDCSCLCFSAARRDFSDWFCSTKSVGFPVRIWVRRLRVCTVGGWYGAQWRGGGPGTLAHWHTPVRAGCSSKQTDASIHWHPACFCFAL